MDRDSILSREEIDALLSAIRDPEEKPRSPVQAWDFSKPRRLPAAELNRIRDRHTPALDPLVRLFKKRLNSPVQVRFLDPSESTWRELLEGRPVDALVARAGDVLVDPSPQAAFALVERAMGAGRLSRPPDRPLRELEADLVTPAIEELLKTLGFASQESVRWGAASKFARESWPEGSCVLLGIEILSEGLLGDILVAMPAAPAARPAASGPAAETGVDIEIAARFPLGTIRLGDLQELAPGDLLVWSGDPAPPVTVAVSKRPGYVARPGTLGGKAAVEILKPAAAESPPALLVRVSGGAPPAGVPEVPVEVRAVLAERTISLKDLGALRPGALIEFPRRPDAPAELHLGRRRIARGPVVRTGDKLAVRIESSAAPDL